VLLGKLVAGTSAGALAPFRIAHISPAKKPAEEAWEFAFQPMLGMINAWATAHADQHDPRQGGRVNELSRLEDFATRLADTDFNIGFGIDNNAAIHVTPQKVEAIHTTENATVHVLGRSESTVTSLACREPGQLDELSGGVFENLAVR